MTARFQRNIGGGTFGSATRTPQRFGFSMGPPAGLGPATPDRHAVFDDDTAHSRVRPSITQPTHSERKGGGHKLLVDE